MGTAARFMGSYPVLAAHRQTSRLERHSSSKTTAVCCVGGAMKLRDHPLMSYHKLHNWPPTWTWIDGPEDKHPTGEIGMLRTALLSKTGPGDRCFLLIRYEESCYLGCIIFEDQVSVVK
jgi:hypothetical protein